MSSEHICTNCNKKYANKTTLNNHLQKCPKSPSKASSIENKTLENIPKTFEEETNKVREELEKYKRMYEEQEREINSLKAEIEILKKIEDKYHSVFEEYVKCVRIQYI